MPQSIDNSILRLSITVPPVTPYLCARNKRKCAPFFIKVKINMGNFVTDITVLAQKPMLTAQEAAIYLGFSLSYLYKRTMSKDIPHYKPNGKTLYFDRLELEEWMKRNRVASNDEVLTKVQTEMACGRKGGRL